MRAAVANGADAVYFGLDGGFNARYRAANFSVDELPRVMEYLHSHNVRGYVAFNTLVFSDELPQALETVRAVAAAGADAVIVQDLGLARLIGRMCPGLHVHGSTQMTLTEPLGIEFVKRLGVRRVILARELSASDIRRIAGATDVPVEVFVHGALCVAYSGQCLTSESLGGRSANRGQCAQACRLPYELVVDGAARDLGEKSYLLSPQDLAAHDLVGDLAALGVCSFKIEGRLKSAHYVAAATQTYRAAIDAAAGGHRFVPTRQQELDLAQSFSRGFTHAFFDGVNHQELVHARFPKSRGVRVGRVTGKTSRGVLVEIEQSRRSQGFTTGGMLNVGDGVVFDEGHPEQDEQGGRIASVTPVPSPRYAGERDRVRGASPRNANNGNRAAPHPRPLPGVPGRGSSGPVVEITFERGGVNLPAVSVGGIVWKTDDPSLRRRLEASFSRDRVARRVPISASVVARVGEALTVTVRDDAGRETAVAWDRPLELAQKFPLDAATFREQFGRLGDTPFELASVTGLDEPSGAMVPKSVLNDLRRQAVQRLLELRQDPSARRVAELDVLERVRGEIAERFGSPGESPETESTPRLHVLARTLEQLQSVLDWKSASTGLAPATVYCEFDDIRQYPAAVALARGAGVPIGLATVRVIKPGEEGLLRQVGAATPDCVLVRNLAGLSFFPAHFPGLPLVADYALNVANEAAAALLAETGVARMVPSYDLSWSQLEAMLGRFPARRFEVVVHQHMPMFHMEHCVFCHTLSTGKDYRDCGRPCDRHRVELKDRAGAAHPLVADVGCRNTVYNAAAQSAAEYVPRMLQAGVRDFRVELLRETGNEVAPLLERYARVIAGVEDGRAAWRQLRVLNQLGVTRGTLGE
jgi:putative protease